MNTKVKLMMVSLILLLFTSCGGDSKTKAVTNSTFTAIINGKPYNAKFASGFQTDVPKTLLLTGAQGDGEDIQLFLPQDISAGTYSYEQFIKGKYQKSDEDFGFASEGSLTITTHDREKKHITGRFNFKTQPMLTSGKSDVVSNGAFSVYY